METDLDLLRIKNSIKFTNNSITGLKKKYVNGLKISYSNKVLIEDC